MGTQPSRTEDIMPAPEQPVVDAGSVDVLQPFVVPSNIFFQVIPQPPDSGPPVLQGVTLWQSWINRQSREYLLKKVQNGELPADDTPPSQLKRASYQTRVLEHFIIRSSPWYGLSFHPYSSFP